MKSDKSNSAIGHSEKVQIEIWSDVVCPFCFLGKKKIELAIAELGAEDQVEIIWHSFQLDPDLPEGESFPSSAYLAERKGYPVEQINTMCASLADQGKSYGIDFQFDKALTFNTKDAHQLIQWAKESNKSNELKGAFMQAYFSEGLDLSLEENLFSVVEKVGLNAKEAKAVLESDSYAVQVEQDIARSRQLGIGGVPFFLIDGSQSISGAQSDHIFKNAIESALEKQGANAR